MIIMDDFTQTLIHYKIAIVLLVLIIIFAFEKINLNYTELLGRDF